MSGSFVEILAFFASTLAHVFVVLDSVYLGTHSLLIWFVSIEFFHITLWFVMSLVNPYFKGDPHDVSGGVAREASHRVRVAGSRLSSYRSSIKKGGKTTRLDGYKGRR